MSLLYNCFIDFICYFFFFFTHIAYKKELIEDDAILSMKETKCKNTSVALDDSDENKEEKKITNKVYETIIVESIGQEVQLEILYQTSRFLVIYKPPYWRMDTSNKYNLNSLNCKDFRYYSSPCHVYIGILLMQKYNVIPTNSSFNAVQRLDVDTSGGIIVVKIIIFFMILEVKFRRIL